MARDRESEREGERESVPQRREVAVAAGLEVYLLSEAGGDSPETAFAKALGRSIERYVESLDPKERLRVLVDLYRPGVPIPEERVLPEDPEGRARALDAARSMAEAGEIRRARNTADGRVYWLRRERPARQCDQSDR